MSHFIRYLVSTIAAISLASTWLYEGLDYIALLSLLAFFLALPKSSWQAFFQGLIFGIIALSIAFSWAPKSLAYITDSDTAWSYQPILIFSFLVFWESLLFASLAYCSSGVLWSKKSNKHGAILLVGCFWVAIEHFLPRVFSWTLAHCIIGISPLMQIADIGGSSIISFMLVIVLLYLASWIIDRFTGQVSGPSPEEAVHKTIQVSKLAVPLVLFCGWYGYGIYTAQRYTVESSQAEELRVGVIQIDPSFSDSTAKMRKASEEIHGQCDLILWPESSLGTYQQDVSTFANSSIPFSSIKPPLIDYSNVLGINCPVIAGGRTFPSHATEDGPFYQTAFLVDSTGHILSTYHKRFLIPFGEFLPGETLFPDLHSTFGLGDWYCTGTDANCLPVRKNCNVGVLICYEDLVPAAARTLSSNGATVLVCIINASAFEEPNALKQHLRLARLRAIENRKYLVRCAGTGISCVIDWHGNMKKSAHPTQEASFVYDVPQQSEHTLYQIFGYHFPNMCLMLFIVVSLRFAWRKRL